MNISEKANKFKRFIEIIDKQIFPEEPLHVYTWRRNEHIKEDDFQIYASFQNHSTLKVNILKKQKVIFLYCYLYFIYLVRYLISKCQIKNNKEKISKIRFLKAKMIKILYGLRFYRIHYRNKLFYSVVSCKSVCSFSDYDLIFIAVHEVRHRIQFQERYVVLRRDISLPIEKFFKKDAKHYFEQKFKENSFYDNSQKSEEVDANFIAYFLETCARQYFKNADRINENDLFSFIKQYSSLMMWKNPSIGT